MRTGRAVAALAVLLALLFAVSPAMAEIPAPSRAFYFLDQANVLSNSTKLEIVFFNHLLYSWCRAQIVVVVVNTLDGVSIDEYALELFNRWGIGDGKKNNGLLLVMSIDDDDYYTIPGMGITEVFTVEVLKETLERCLEPHFAARHYDAGVKAWFEDVLARMIDTQGTMNP